MWSLVLLLATQISAENLSPDYCLANAACTHNANCSYGSFSGVCCGGKCRERWPEVYRGEECTPNDDCDGACFGPVGSVCDPFSARCSTPKGHDCPCSTDTQCLGAQNCIDGRCLQMNVPVGQFCRKALQCVSGICDTTTQTCKGISSGYACTGEGTCGAGLSCMDSSSTGTFTCERRQSDNKCVRDLDCLQSDYCAASGYCKPWRLVGQSCVDTVNQKCKPGTVCSEGKCAERQSMARGGNCTTSDVCHFLDFCDSLTLKCVQRNQVAPLGACYDTAQCPEYALCVAGKCTQSYVGQVCHSNDTVLCGGLPSLQCGCDRRCFVSKTRQELSACNDAEMALRLAQLPAVYDPLQLPEQDLQTYLDWRCCTGCLDHNQKNIRSSSSSFHTRYDGGTSEALGGYQIDCSFGKGKYKIRAIDSCNQFAPDPLMLLGCGASATARKRVVVGVVVAVFTILGALILCFSIGFFKMRKHGRQHEKLKLVSRHEYRSTGGGYGMVESATDEDGQHKDSTFTTF